VDQLQAEVEIPGGRDDVSLRRPIPMIGESGDDANVGKAALTNLESLEPKW